jgi:general secretion pathway protein K
MRHRQGGVALVLVLWVVTLLAVIAGNFAFSMRNEAQIARNFLSTAQARAFADAGVHRAWHELMKPPSDALRWQADGLPREFNFQGAVLRVTLEDESGKIDINTASDALLMGLLMSVGLNADASTKLLDAILDWRDADKLRRLHGAEEEDYRAAGKSYVPSNAPFETVDELRRVLGMTSALFRKLTPAVTVHSKQMGINTTVAPPAALLAIPGSSPVLVEQYLTLRQGLLASGQKVPVFPGAGAFASASTGMPTFMARSEARLPDGSVFVRLAAARVTPDPKRPVTVLRWGDGESELAIEKQ